MQDQTPQITNDPIHAVETVSKFDGLLESLIQFAPKVLIAVAILFIGLKVLGRVKKFISSYLEKMNWDKDLIPFITSMIDGLLKVLLFLTAAEIVGVKTASFVALLAAAGFALGMALQGSLGNFASGVMILLFKPYKTGDLIEVAESTGWVQEIQIFNTILKTVTNQTVIVPNSLATSGKIINHSSNGFVRVDLFSAIPYAEDFTKVEQAILSEVSEIPEVLTDPAPRVGIQEFDSHNIKVGTFLHTQPEDYWTVYYAANKAIKNALGKNQIQMAYSEGIELGSIGAN